MRHQYYAGFCSRQGKLRLRVLGSGCARCSAEEWNETVVSPGYSRLYYILGGDAYVVFGGKLVPLLPMCCYLLPTGLSLRYGCKTWMEQLYFHVKLLDENGYDLLGDCPQPMSGAFFRREAERLQQLAASKESAEGLLLESELLRALAELFLAHGFTPAAPALSPCVGAAVARIGAAPSIQLSLSALAEQSFVSESQLTKKFRAEIGKPIGRYIDDMVFLEAEQLLSQSLLSMAEISARLGFCDQFYFSRRFKEKYGMTPKRYRESRII